MILRKNGRHTFKAYYTLGSRYRAIFWALIERDLVQPDNDYGPIKNHGGGSLYRARTDNENPLYNT